MCLRNNLDCAILLYIDAFIQKHELVFEHEINDDLTDMLCFGEYHFTLNDIVHDIDTNQPKGLILEWHDTDTIINFKSYCMGLRNEHLCR